MIYDCLQVDVQGKTLTVIAGCCACCSFCLRRTWHITPINSFWMLTVWGMQDGPRLCNQMQIKTHLSMSRSYTATMSSYVRPGLISLVTSAPLICQILLFRRTENQGPCRKSHLPIGFQRFRIHEDMSTHLLPKARSCTAPRANVRSLLS
jgi:hypothetical protein